MTTTNDSSSTSYSPDCFTFIERQIAEIRGGARPYPIFFVNETCSYAYSTTNGSAYQAYWPRTPLPDNMYNRDIAPFLCEPRGSTPTTCPIPEVRSLILPPNVRLKFKANQHRLRSMRSGGFVDSADALESIQELGQVHLYATQRSDGFNDDNTALFNGMNIIEDLEQNKLMWYSSGDSFVSSSESGNGYVVIGELQQQNFERPIPNDWEPRTADVKKAHSQRPGEAGGMLYLGTQAASNCIFPTLYNQGTLFQDTHASTALVDDDANRIGHDQVTYARMPGRPGQIQLDWGNDSYFMSRSLYGTDQADVENRHSQYQGMLASLLSCGSPFFPSFTGLRPTWRNEVETWEPAWNQSATTGVSWAQLRANQANHPNNTGMTTWPLPTSALHDGWRGYDSAFIDPLCATYPIIDAQLGSWSIQNDNWTMMTTDALVQHGVQMRNTQLLHNDNPNLGPSTWKMFDDNTWQSYRFHSTGVITPPYQTFARWERTNPGIDAFNMIWTDTTMNTSLRRRPVSSLFEDAFDYQNINHNVVDAMPCTHLRVDHSTFESPRGPSFIAGVDLESNSTPDLLIVDGSVGSLEIEFVDDEHNVVSWQDVQRLWCMKSVRGDPPPTFGGMPIMGYEQGSLNCDQIMQDACSNSTTNVNDPSMTEACGCIQEMNQLLREHVNDTIPIHCMSANCQGFNTRVYNPNATEQNCTTNICQQSVQSNVFNTSIQTSQDMTCGTHSTMNNTPTVLNIDNSYVRQTTDYTALVTYGVLIFVFAISVIILVGILKYLLF